MFAGKILLSSHYKINVGRHTMDFTLISTFIDLAATGNFSRTAERMHITQSAVSARIKTLEQSMNCLLFKRDHNGAALTESGRRFLVYAKSINRLWRQSVQDAALGTDTVSQVGIGVHVCLWRRVALQWVDGMRAAVPGVYTRLEVDYSEVISDFVGNGTLDLAVIYTPQPAPGLRIEKLFEDHLVLVSDRLEELGPQLAQRYIYIDWSYGYRQAHAELLPDLMAPRTIIGNPEAAMSFLQNQGGAAFFPLSDVEDMIATRKLYRVKGAPVIRRPCYVTYPENSAKAGLIATAIEILRDVTRGLGAGPQEVVNHAPRSFVVA